MAKKDILFINFSKREIERVTSEIPIDIHRGYIGKNNKKGSFLFYSPFSVHEYDSIIINFNKNQNIIEEFSEKARPISQEELKKIYHYWIFGENPIIAFLGNFPDNIILNFLQVGGYNLKDALEGDRTINVRNRIPSNLEKIFRKEKNEIKIPPKKYIKINKEESIYSKDELGSFFDFISLYTNNSSDLIGGYHRLKNGNTYHPSLFLLPDFKDKKGVLVKLIRELSKYYDNKFNKVQNKDWKKNEKYYPKKVKKYSKLIKETKEKAEKEIEKLEKEKEEKKDYYEFINNLLTTKDDDKLGQSVYKVLTEVLDLNVTNSDKESDKVKKDQDFIIHLKNKDLLVEVKGTKSENPSESYMTQVWKHIQRSEKEINDGVLILNYDLNSPPDNRSKAYIDEKAKKQLEDIVFIDSRVLFKICIAVIDYDMSKEKAVDILFQKGRVAFNLEECKK